jgi:hypothetical protein
MSGGKRRVVPIVFAAVAVLSVAGIALAAGAGKLSFVSSSPDGDNVYVTADNDDSVVTFQRRH